MNTNPIPFDNHCAICKKREATQLCDYIIGYDNSVIFVRNRILFNKLNSPGYKHETCDLPLCKECANNVGHHVDLCPHHYQLHQQVELPENLRMAQARSKGKVYSITGRDIQHD